MLIESVRELLVKLDYFMFQTPTAGNCTVNFNQVVYPNKMYYNFRYILINPNAITPDYHTREMIRAD